jgi:nucleotide-binding universal stress UspA family protein
MKILVPIDLIHSILPTLDLLDHLVDLKQADVKFLYVREMLPAYENLMQSVGSFADDWDRQLDQKASNLFAEARARIEGKCRSVDDELATGPAAMMIEQVARDEAYPVTVLTPGKHSPAERLFAGSVTARAVEHVPGTVIVARPNEKIAQGGLKRIMIGFDGSHNAREAIERSLVQFRIVESGADVVIVHSVDMIEPIKFMTPIAFVSALEQNMLMQGQAFLAEAEKLLKVAGVKKFDCCLVEGDPAAELTKMAKDTNADLLIIGAQGHSAIERFVVGSVSEKVASHAPCSVAVIKPEKAKKKK